MIRGSLLLIVLSIAAIVYWRYIRESPVDYASDIEHFKYGSIGADSDAGIPYWVWRVMPQVCPGHLPHPAAFRALPADEQSGLAGYQQFGFLIEEGKDRPIGFSMRRVQIDRVGLDCAACHSSSVRVSEGMDPARIYPAGYVQYLDSSKSRVLIFGMPANTVDLQGYFEFLFACAADPYFTVDNVMSHIAAVATLGPVERFLYRLSIPVMRERLLLRRGQFEFFAQMPPFGPGRVDTFSPYKAAFFHFPYDGTIGTADFPSLWNQRPRVGMHLHWDGDNQSVFERNISASLGAGATPTSLDMTRMLRVAYWIGCPDPRANPSPEEQARAIKAARLDPVPHQLELPIPKYPFAVIAELAHAGEGVYIRECAACHGWQGEHVGEVLPIEKIGTDPHRLDSFTPEFAKSQNTLGTGLWWHFHNFQKTNGYANMPLDGIWARAPYLHNGSAPTLSDMLAKPQDRPKQFYRGDDRYDPVNVGFRSDRRVSDDGRELFQFTVATQGNGNSGHTYGNNLSEADKRALLEYLKTL
ncbi:MAG: c-type cytochrome [Acidobacteriia bacterium]|nr:c-type cytochrome [Terriglobia bacterium]